MSYWHLTAPPAIGGREGWLPKKCEVAVIGGGLTGILTAYMLRRAGIRAIVIESHEVGYGQSASSTGKITVATGLTYGKLLTERGAAAARIYAEAQSRALDEYREVIRREGIRCDYEELPAALYTRRAPEKLEAEAIAARGAGLRVEMKRRTALPFDVSLALVYPGQAQFHPVKFLAALARRVDVYTGLTVTDVRGNSLLMDDGQEMEAEKIVYACHYPFRNFPGLYFMKLYQSLSYGIALGGITPLPGMYFGIDRGGLSLRSHGNTLLLVGGGHRTGEWGRDPEHTGLSYLRAAAIRYYPRIRVVSEWAGQDCISPDGLPLIGTYSSLAPDHFVATGFSKWGIAGSMVAATLLTDLITGRQNAVAPYLHPGRFGADTLRTTIAQGGRAAAGLGKRLLPAAEVAEELAPGAGGIVRAGGKNVAAYRDNGGVLHTVAPVCSHLGCALTWNPDTKTWDCPCHGSRFSESGSVVSSPAVKPLANLPDKSGNLTDRKEQKR